MLDDIKETIAGFFKPGKNNNDDNKQEIKDIKDEIYQDEVVRMVKQEFEQRRQDRLPFELQWQLNSNFLAGNQYCDINFEMQQIQEYDRIYWWQEREVYNHIAPIVETRLAKLSRVRPAMIVRPSTNDLEDVSTAKVCTSIVKSAYKRLAMSKLIQRANGWSEVCGTVFYKTIWDKNAGKLLGMINNEPIFEGEVITTVVPPYEIFPDSNFNEDISECRSIIHAKPYHVAEIEEIWGVKLEGEEVDVFSLMSTDIGTGGLGYTSTVPKITSSTKKNHQIVIEYYERPSKQYPEGRLIIVAGNKLLHYSSLPFAVGEDFKRDFPFSRQVCVEQTGCFWGTSIIERCIPIQRAYNAVKNRKHEFLNRLALGVLDVESDAYEDMDDLEEEGLSPGKILIRTPGKEPARFLEGQSIPPQFAQDEDQLTHEFILISGVSEISRNSAAPSGAGSGVALQLLTEQDDTRLSLSAENIRFAVLKVGKQWLRLYKQFAVGPRMARLVGVNGDVLVSVWTNNDITSDDIALETENELTQTPAQRKQMIFDLMHEGLFIDPTTGHMTKRMRSKILEAFDMGNWESSDDIDELQITRAQRENMELENGVIPQIREVDDDELHVQEHTYYMLSGDYEKLLEEQPDLANMLAEHIEMHKKAIDLKNQLEMQKQMLMQQGIVPD